MLLWGMIGNEGLPGIGNGYLLASGYRRCSAPVYLSSSGSSPLLSPGYRLAVVVIGTDWGSTLG